jgi:hypothetical protein
MARVFRIRDGALLDEGCLAYMCEKMHINTNTFVNLFVYLCVHDYVSYICIHLDICTCVYYLH